MFRSRLNRDSTIANGGISDEDGDAQKEGRKMKAETVYVLSTFYFPRRN